MSIWCSREHIGNETDWPEPGMPGVVASYAEGWSNHYPDPVAGPESECGISTAHIPTWCVPGHEETAGVDDERPFGEWLRLDVNGWEHDFHNPRVRPTEQRLVSVVLDETAARSLAAELLAWADAEHVQAKR